MAKCLSQATQWSLLMLLRSEIRSSAIFFARLLLFVIVLPTVSALASSEQSGGNDGWRIHLQHQKPYLDPWMGGDLGGVVLVSTGGIAFVEPVDSFRFSCETRLSDQEQRAVAVLVAAFRHETAALDDGLGVYPGQGSAVYDRLNSVDSPYTHLSIATQSWVDDAPASSRRVYLSYTELGLIQDVYPGLFALASVLIDLRDSRADRCSKNLSEGRK